MIDWKPGHWPRVGVGVFVIRDGKILIGWRVGSHGPGYWSPPGGKVERGETVEACAVRETREEAGLTLERPRKASVFTDDHWEEEGKHFVTVYVIGDAPTGDPKVLEPDTLTDWQWASWDNLPRPLLPTIEKLLEQGYRPPGT